MPRLLRCRTRNQSEAHFLRFPHLLCLATHESPNTRLSSLSSCAPLPFLERSFATLCIWHTPTHPSRFSENATNFGKWFLATSSKLSHFLFCASQVPLSVLLTQHLAQCRHHRLPRVPPRQTQEGGAGPKSSSARHFRTKDSAWWGR